MDLVYVLQLSYKKSKEEIEEKTIMGVYSSETKAWEAFENVKLSLLFKDYIINCIAVSKFEIDKTDGPISFTNQGYLTE